MPLSAISAYLDLVGVGTYFEQVSSSRDCTSVWVLPSNYIFHKATMTQGLNDCGIVDLILGVACCSPLHPAWT
jgi:hypothetical protein